MCGLISAKWFTQTFVVDFVSFWMRIVVILPETKKKRKNFPVMPMAFYRDWNDYNRHLMESVSWFRLRISNSIQNHTNNKKHIKTTTSKFVSSKSQCKDPRKRPYFAFILVLIYFNRWFIEMNYVCALRAYRKIVKWKSTEKIKQNPQKSVGSFFILTTIHGILLVIFFS